ncbi:substrate-binding domain-containing protein [Nonomuraea ferruginea]
MVKNGAEAAGQEYGVTVTYQGDGDPAKQSQLIDQAVSGKADGIVVSMANPDALREAVGKAVAAKIPVVTINSGGGLVQGVRRGHARRPVGGRGRARRGRAAQGRRGDQAAVRDPRG